MSVLNQKTIKEPIKFSGVGLHTGKKVNMKIFPAEPNTGIIFKRVDIDEPVYIEALLENVVSTNRGTAIGKNNVKIYTVEHLLSALYALEIDNLFIDPSV